MKFWAAVLAGWLLMTPLVTGVIPATADDSGGAARRWFAAEGNKLAAATTGYLPTDAPVAPDSKPEVGDITQVSAWSESMLRGSYSLKTATKRINMWVAPVAQSGNLLGVIVYTSTSQRLYPVALPEASTLAPKVTEGIPEPTVKPEDNHGSEAGDAVEPKNSHLPVKSNPPGAAYILPDLARALTHRTKNTRRPTIPIYDPVIEGWFILSDDQLSAVSATARAHLAGSAALIQVREAIQSWWGTAKVTPAPELPDTVTGSAPTAIWIVLTALLGAGVVAALILVAVQRQAKAYEEVVPLEDTELIIVPPPPPTTAVPTITVSAAEALTH